MHVKKLYTYLRSIGLEKKVPKYPKIVRTGTYKYIDILLFSFFLAKQIFELFSPYNSLHNKERGSSEVSTVQACHRTKTSRVKWGSVAIPRKDSARSRLACLSDCAGSQSAHRV